MQINYDMGHRLETLLHNGEIEKFSKRFLFFDELPENWHNDVISNLGQNLIIEVLSLSNLKGNVNRLNDVSWHGRNLLELSVWIDYCTRDIKNAKRFYDDNGRDHLDMIDKTDAWAKNNDSFNYNSKLKADALAVLYKNANDFLVDLEGEYLKVGNVARELGHKNFEIFNKIFSKFVHMTSYSLMTNNNDKVRLTIFPIHYNLACIAFFQGYEKLNAYLKEIEGNNYGQRKLF